MRVEGVEGVRVEGVEEWRLEVEVGEEWGAEAVAGADQAVREALKEAGRQLQRHLLLLIRWHDLLAAHPMQFPAETDQLEAAQWVENTRKEAETTWRQVRSLGQQ